VSGDFLRNDLSIESPDGRSSPDHDHTRQYHEFARLETFSMRATYSSLNFVPDALGDVFFDGIAQNAFRQNLGTSNRFQLSRPASSLRPNLSRFPSPHLQLLGAGLRTQCVVSYRHGT